MNILDRLKLKFGIWNKSSRYWEMRYKTGGTSGDGSYGILAEYKAGFINDFCGKHGVHSAIEFGCGDGNQLALFNFDRYLGLDVSATAIDRCKKIFSTDTTKSFKILDDYSHEKSEVSLSLDVIYHIIEDAEYEKYMRCLTEASV